MEKQFVVLGLGIFGSTLVKTLSQYGREVIAIYKNPENVQRVADFATKAVIGYGCRNCCYWRSIRR